MSNTSGATWAASCPHCGRNVIHLGPCPNIRAIEYHPNGTIKRIEYRDVFIEEQGQ